MDLVNGQVIYENGRVIALKKTDMSRLGEVFEKEILASSFTETDEVVSDIPVQEQTVIVEPSPEEVISEVVVPAQPESVPEPQVQASIFDQAMPNFDQGVPAGVSENINPVVEPQMPVQEVAPVYDNTPIFNEVPSAKQEDVMAPNLDTPQTFFDRVEKNPEVSNAEVQSYESEDPALILLGNLKDVIESKNQMIQALNDKVIVLEEQLRVSAEQLRVSEESKNILAEQRKAAELTLQNARREQEANGGPTLVYQQQQNYQQAA